MRTHTYVESVYTHKYTIRIVTTSTLTQAHTHARARTELMLRVGYTRTQVSCLLTLPLLQVQAVSNVASAVAATPGKVRAFTGEWRAVYVSLRGMTDFF